MNETIMTAGARTAPAAPLRIGRLGRGDLDAVVAIDRALSGRTRYGFFARRLDHAARDPAAFVALAAACDGRFAGFILARICEGEFGAASREASLDAIGVDRAPGRPHGVGRALIDNLAAELRARGIGELATQVAWTDHGLLGFFARTGFELAPRIVLERAACEPLPDGRVPLVRAGGDSAEIDYGRAPDDDFQSLAHDRLPVRSMTRNDLDAVVEIDRRITGRSRAAYYTRKLDEAFGESAVQMSLVAERDGLPAGFVMARVDSGEFGHTEPEAVMDTIGVDPRHSHKGVATALLSQLVANLGALRTETLRTEVGWNQFGLLRFLERMGFRPHRRLALRLGLG
ncbi:MAG TPA: GNAT family N-acetyltransferase [Acetobacteraceae bacterium]|nr:GNAT family N-acetyltransferase [Acetobacteraceae bacterium]